MKKLLIIGILILSVILISGCTSDEQASSDISTSSQSNQKSDTQNPELIIKQSDVPGLTLSSYNFYAVPKSTPDMSIDDFNITEVNETTAMIVLMLPNLLSSSRIYDLQTYGNVLPLGTRNVGQISSWKDESGREVSAYLIKFDSSKSYSKSYAEAWGFLEDYAKKNPEQISDNGPLGNINNKVDLNIGDYSYYISQQDQSNLNIQITTLVFLYKNNYVLIEVKDETDDSVNEAIRIAKKIKSRLN